MFEYFDYREWNGKDVISEYYDCVLTRRFGPFKEGTRFAVITITPEEVYLDDQCFTYKLSMEKIECQPK